jgi:DNA-binding NarL/FixJ family response regulator
MRYQGVMPLRIFFLDDHEVVRRGIEVCRDICSAHPEVACVMLTSVADMFLDEKTVKNHVSRLLSKLGIQRRSEAAAHGARLAERQQKAPT